MLDQLFRGLLRGRAQSEDQFINDIMTNRMFETDPFQGNMVYAKFNRFFVIKSTNFKVVIYSIH